MSFVIDQLEIWRRQDGHQLHGKLDLARIGMSGHSFGAGTTLAVAGRTRSPNRSFADARITAFLALSPQPGNGTRAADALGHLAKPILCMTGTEDGSPIDVTLRPSDRRQVFAALPAGDKYQLVLFGAEHSAFGGRHRAGIGRRDPNHHPAILQISVQFWNAYLKGDAEAKQWLQSTQPISATGLSDADVWEWK